MLLPALFFIFCSFTLVVAEMTFEIRGYEITQNELIPDGDIQELLWPYIGHTRTTEDVEKARAEVEKYFQQQGYLRVMVNIPEQTLESGIVRLEVLDSKVGRVQVTGNRYYTKEMLLRELPSITPGQVLNVADINNDFGKIARNPNLKIKLGLVPGRKPGEDTVQLEVEDKLPLHGRIELNNHASHDTSNLRLSGMIRYDNLWQKNHSISLQAQTSPENTDEVQVVSSSYVMPSSWDPEQLFVFYAVWSNSESSTGGDINVVGKGNILGARYIQPLSGTKNYAHNLTIGVDYKKFDETVDFSDGSEDPIVTPISYVPISLNYGSSLRGETGFTLFSSGITATVRGLGAEQKEFATKNYQSRGNYLRFNASVERRQQLPASMHLNLKLQGQLASEPLISNEQFSAGGVDSVHGYKESEASGDNAFAASVELVGPELFKLAGCDYRATATPRLIYEHSSIELIEPLPGQDEHISLNGLGAAVQGQLREGLEYRFDWGLALSETGKTDSGTQRVYFSLVYQF